MTTRPVNAVAIVALVLFTGAAIAVAPLIAPLVLAAWMAHVVRPLYNRLARFFRGRNAAAAILSAIIVLAMLAPLVLAFTTLVPAAKSLFAQLREASEGRKIFTALVENGEASQGLSFEPKKLVELLKDYGAGAGQALLTVATASFDALVTLFIFFVAFFTILVDGKKGYAWLSRHAPVPPRVLDRLTGAFNEAGNGLLIGTGGTALIQGLLAMALYAVLGVPRAPLLGLLTIVAALIPVTGPPLVWVPIALGLAFTGNVGKAIVLAVLGVGLIGTIDNITRPWLARRANIGLPTIVVLVSMFGGIAVFGGWGLLLGPLVLRLAVEVLVITSELRTFVTAEDVARTESQP